ncbi:MAG: SDR family NAD(P)-dependent oxidoreductase [Candidatus Aminicenantes bacterium]|nr:SDR family NAD(P)-dependent oxidoreductase [Candidatus Aminicenantes bacterium]
MRARRVALVTGGGRGVGRAIAAALAGPAEAVAVHVRRLGTDGEATAGLVRRAGAESAVFEADLGDAVRARDLVRRVVRTFGRVDILVNNVGPILVKPWDALSAADWEAMVRGNLLSAYHCLKAVLPGMRRRRWGRIVNLGFGRIEQAAAFPTILPYAAAKAALLLLTRTAAAAEAGSGVTVNMVSPGLLEGGVLPAGRPVRPSAVGRPSDVAAAVRFLASEEASGTTGANVIVAGTWKM